MKRNLFLLAISTTALAATRTYAAEPATRMELEEIVVTAQKRSENLQDVGAAITAFNADQIDRLGIRGLNDLTVMVPSLQLAEVGPGEAEVSMRGLVTGYGLAPTVSFYFDETPLDLRSDLRAGTSTPNLFDVDRVEVLRGPQGTLYGSSSLGGAIKVLARRPDPSGFALIASGGVSQVDGGDTGYSLKSAVNVPLSDNLAVRVVGIREEVGGFVDRVQPTDWYEAAPQDPIVGRSINGYETTEFRGSLLWEPDGGWSIRPGFTYMKSASQGRNSFETNRGRYLQGGLVNESFENETKIASLVVEKDLGFASILSSSSYLKKQSDSYNDYSGLAAQLSVAFAGTALPLYPLVSLDPVSYEQVAQEIRLVSARSERLNWIAGAYFNSTDQRVGQYFEDDAYAAFLHEVFGVSPVGRSFDYDQHNSDRQKAVFAEADLAVTPRLHLIAGARYYDLDQTFRSVSGGILAGPEQPLVRSGASGVNPKASIKFDATAGATFYATAAAGFRPGGPNPLIIGPCTLADVYRTSYGDDNVWNYEVGAKLAPAGAQVSFNVAAFQIDWKDIQQAVVDPGCGSLFTANVGEARSRGIEAELTWRPLPQLLLSGGGSYVDAQFTSIDEAFAEALPIATGDRVTDVPRVQVNLGAELRLPLTSTVSGYLRGDAHYTGSTPGSFSDRSPNTLRRSYKLLNASAGVQFGSTELELRVRNIADDVIYMGAESFGETFGYMLVGMPRTFELNATYQFGQ